MDCAGFDRWLDRGAVPANDEALRHAAVCGRCAASMEAMREVDAWLAGDDDLAPAPAGFTDAVMRRVAIEPRTAPVVVLADDFPWWIGALRHPATVFAALLTAVVWWAREYVIAAGAYLLTYGNWAWSQASEFGYAAAVALHPASAVEVLPALSDPLVAAAVAVAVLPLVAYVSIRLERWSERLAGG